MDESFGGMFKLTGSNYSVWKLNVRGMLECKDLWLPVQYDNEKIDKINASTWEVMHLKAATYIRCFIDMSLYNNFDEETSADVLWKKIGVMFENKNVVNRVSVFRKIVRLQYQDGSSMAEHINAFQGLMNQTTSLEVPLVDEVLTLLLLGSLPDNWETLVVTLGNAGPEGKHLSLETVKSSLLNEEARQKDRECVSNHKTLVTEGESNRGRGTQRSPQNRGRFRPRSKSKGRITCFYYGKSRHFKKKCRHYQKDKGNSRISGYTN